MFRTLIVEGLSRDSSPRAENLIGGMVVTEPIQQVKAEFFKALAHPARIRVLELLSDGERSVGELVEEVGLESSHLSQQLGVLRRANLVHTRKEGSTVVYSLADRRVVKVLQLAKEILLSYLTNTADLLSDVR